MDPLQPDASLEAVLAQFGQQPGVSPDEQAQLRSAITADPQLLEQLDQAAQAGRLRGFAFPAAGNAAPNRVGHYDIQSGVVSLPMAAFQASGTAPSADLKAVMQVQDMAIRFGNSTYVDPLQPGVATQASHPVSQDMLDNLLDTISASPVLADQVKLAATTRDPGANPPAMLLENFGFVSANMLAGGTYNGLTHSMNLPPHSLQTQSPSTPYGLFRADDLTFVIGHEIQHGFNHPGKTQASLAFVQQVGEIAGSTSVVHDYTTALRDYIQASRENEATAEIAGWNALLSRRQQTDPAFSLEDMQRRTNTWGRVDDFVVWDAATGATVPRPGLVFNPDNTLSPSPANIAAMGQHYFNRPDPSAPQALRPVYLGESGKVDYPNLYGTRAIETIIHVERLHAQQHPGVVHKLTIDMAGIGLKEHLMEQEGIKIQIDKATPQPYYDTSQTPTAQGNFHHTQDGSVNAQHDHQHVPVAPVGNGRAGEQGRPEQETRRPERTGALQLDNPAHANHAMYATLLRVVHERDRALGREPDEISRQLAGGLVEQARARGLQTIGAATFMAEGSRVAMTDTADLSAPWARTAVGEVGQLVGKPLSHSSDAVAAINQQQALEQSPKQSPPTPGMDGPDAPAPRTR
jgi:hypothetical protein